MSSPHNIKKVYSNYFVIDSYLSILRYFDALIYGLSLLQLWRLLLCAQIFLCFYLIPLLLLGCCHFSCIDTQKSMSLSLKVCQGILCNYRV